MIHKAKYCVCVYIYIYIYNIYKHLKKNIKTGFEKVIIIEEFFFIAKCLYNRVFEILRQYILLTYISYITLLNVLQ